MCSKSGNVQRHYMELTFKEITCQCQIRKYLNRFYKLGAYKRVDYATDLSNREVVQGSPPTLH